MGERSGSSRGVANVTETTADGRPITLRPTIDLEKSPRDWLLAFVASSPVVVARQLTNLMRVRDDAPPGLVAELVADGLIEAAPRLRSQGQAYRITAAGLRAIGSDLPVPELDLRRYWQDLGAGWLSVAARRGIFGEEIERVFTGREMRAADSRATAMDGSVVGSGWSEAVRAKAADASFAVWPGPVNGQGTGVAHYPDLTLVVPQGRMAMQLVLEAPGRRWAAAVVDAYARKPHLARTVLIAPSRAVVASLVDVIERCGAGDRVTVQQGRMTLA